MTGQKRQILIEKLRHGDVAPSDERGQQRGKNPPEAGVCCHLTGQKKNTGMTPHL